LRNGFRGFTVFVHKRGVLNNGPHVPGCPVIGLVFWTFAHGVPSWRRRTRGPNQQNTRPPLLSRIAKRRPRTGALAVSFGAPLAYVFGDTPNGFHLRERGGVIAGHFARRVLAITRTTKRQRRETCRNFVG
jgi:hypothetical protein